MTGPGDHPAAPAMSAPIVVPMHGIPVPEADANHEGAYASPAKVPPRFSGRVSRVLIPEQALRRRITDMARELASHHPPDGELVITPVLNGAFMFAADLARALGAVSTLDVRFEFAKTSTYGSSLGAGGDQRRVQIDLQPADVVGRSMLLVDDILDHGFTLCALRDRMAGWGVRHVQVCVLLDKQLTNPSPETLAQRAKAAPDLIGFRIPDVWVAGYGLDAAGALRQLPGIVAVDPEA
jgi:hypoxanthine phosphoribosyltransferase